jgi:hypothetical protein
VPTLLGHFEGRRLESLRIWHMVTAHDAAHAGPVVGEGEGRTMEQLASIECCRGERWLLGAGYPKQTSSRRLDKW